MFTKLLIISTVMLTLMGCAKHDPEFKYEEHCQVLSNCIDNDNCSCATTSFMVNQCIMVCVPTPVPSPSPSLTPIPLRPYPETQI